MKYLKYVLFISLFFSCCSESLSPDETKLQGKWKITNELISGEEITIYKEITFKDHNFLLKMRYSNDVYGTGSGEFTVSGNYRTDSSMIYLDGIFIKSNYVAGDIDTKKKKYENTERRFKEKLIYRFDNNNDTLILSDAMEVSDKLSDDNSRLKEPQYFAKGY